MAELGVTKAAAGSSTPEIGVTKAAAGSSTPEIGVTKAAAGSSTPEIGVIKASEIDITKGTTVSFNPAITIALTQALLDKAAANGEMGLTKAMLDKYLIRKHRIKLPAGSLTPKEECKAETLVTKERVPDFEIERIKSRSLQKMSPLKECIAAGDPKCRERLMASIANINYLVDLEQDCLRQYKEKGYAEIGVDYTGEFKKVFILPNPEAKERGKWVLGLLSGVLLCLSIGSAVMLSNRLRIY